MFKKQNIASTKQNIASSNPNLSPKKQEESVLRSSEFYRSLGLKHKKYFCFKNLI